ncbi:MAG: hypothetical protein HKL80_10445 [Acidimicrobiales bacterium]|nr:hypothetical protein [Acidimicrobiales bacterium]
MAQMWGANPDELDALALRVQGAAEALDTIRGQINAGLLSARWEGPDANMSRELWSSKHSPMLENSVSGLREAATLLKSNAQAQREASGVGGGSSGSWFKTIEGFFGNKTAQGVAGGFSFFSGLESIFQVGEGGMKTIATLEHDPVFGYFMTLERVETNGILGTIADSGVLDVASKVLAPLGVAVSLFQLAHSAPAFFSSLQKTGWSVPTVENGLSSVSDIAEGAGGVMLLTPAAPVGAVLIAAGAGIQLGEFVYNLDPNMLSDASRGAQYIGGQVVSGVEDVGKGVIQGAGTAVNDVSSTVGNFVSNIHVSFPPW